MKRAFIVVGLQYGDEGKGPTVDFLTHKFKAGLNVRFNGGSQAGHTVTLSNGKSHTFSQFGSGTFSGADTYISEHVCVDPQTMINEAQHLEQLGIRNPLFRMNIHKDALIITPYHRHASKRNAAIHKRGTTGMGVGETRRFASKYPQHALRIGDLWHEEVLNEKLYGIASLYREEVSNILYECYYDIVSDINVVDNDEWSSMQGRYDTVIFEGSQGLGIDPVHGYPPYVTSGDCTSSNAWDLIEKIRPHPEVDVIGCARIYSIRHGQGPFPTESEKLDRSLYDMNNPTDSFRGPMRYGWLDFDLLQRAVNINQVDYLSISHLDEWGKVGQGIQGNLDDFLNRLKNITGKQIAILGSGPTREDRIWTL